MNDKTGLLAEHNLWDFWESIGENKQQLIIEYYKTHPTFWDYNTLFIGNSVNGIEHGDIDLLNTIFVIGDLELCDLFFKKFLEYTPINYNQCSAWGKNWTAKKVAEIEIWEYIVNRADSNEKAEKIKTLENKKSINFQDVYWKDAHFFLANYSKFVYKGFLNGKCNIERFEIAFLLEFNKRFQIQYSVKKILNTKCRNGVFEQYLIFLEKQKRYQDCIEIIDELKNIGWSNDFEKRLIRCKQKIQKNDDKS